MATIKRVGYGQVEDNHLSAKRNGRVYAQLPAAEGIDILENGQFVKYDYAAGEVNLDGNGEWFLVYNEEKLYDPRHQMHKDFALERENGSLVPRVLGLTPGDIYTTNMIVEENVSVGDRLAPNDQGILAPANDGFIQVAAITTLPDMQKAVKLQVIANQ